MAKWGEGDPRWIVEERADAKNPNNWHWTEKNASSWSIEKLKNLLLNLKVEDDKIGYLEIKEIMSITGEATANNRKGKLIFFYEWEIKGQWEGFVNGQDKKIKGEFFVPNLSEENEAHEVDVNVTLKDDKIDGADLLKTLLRKKGTDLMRDKFGIYIKELKNEYSQGLILPAKNGATTQKSSPVKKENTIKQKIAQPVKAQTTETKVGVKIDTRRLTDKIEFACGPTELFRALTEKEMVIGFTNNGVGSFEGVKGGRFSLFGGSVCGEFVDLKPNEKIVMKWRSKSWPDEHYSTVTLDLEDKEGQTILSLLQTGIPAADADRTKEGWHRYYWNPIRQAFGYGARLF